jgi:hypothetical protein
MSFQEMSLQEMLAEAASFRGEVSAPDVMVEAAHAASHRLGWGATEEDVQAELVEDHGLSPENAFLAVKMGALLG